MEYDEIKKLMEDMNNLNITNLSIELQDGTKVSMQRNSSDLAPVLPKTETVEEAKPLNEDNYEYITSPIVGTFYLKPSPKAEAFVKVGDHIHKKDTVCIIEAMKLMNEIEAGFDGEVVEILVQDKDPVEYGTKLFKIK